MKKTAVGCGHPACWNGQLLAAPVRAPSPCGSSAAVLLLPSGLSSQAPNGWNDHVEGNKPKRQSPNILCSVFSIPHQCSTKVGATKQHLRRRKDGCNLGSTSMFHNSDPHGAGDDVSPSHGAPQPFCDAQRCSELQPWIHSGLSACCCLLCISRARPGVRQSLHPHYCS